MSVCPTIILPIITLAHVGGGRRRVKIGGGHGVGRFEENQY